MNVVFIIAGAVWIYPVLSLMVVRMTSEHIPLRRKIFLISLASVLLTALCMMLGICTRSSYFNVWMVTNFYFVVYMGLWWQALRPDSIARVVAILVLFFILPIGYLFGTMYVTGRSGGNYNSFLAAEAWANKRISIKAYRGSSYYLIGGLHVEVHKTVPFLPVLQYKVYEQDYHHSLAYCGKLEARYDAHKQELYMTVIAPWGMDTHTTDWGDTIKLR